MLLGRGSSGISGVFLITEIVHSRKLSNDVWVLPVLSATVFLPTMWFVGFRGTSYALGTIAASLLALIIVLLVARSPTRRVSLSDIHIDRVLLFTMGALAFQSMCAYALVGQFHLVRFAGSIGLLLTMLAGAYSVSTLISEASETVVRRMLLWLTGILALMAVAAAFGWTLVTGTRFERPIFIFAEPSHFALVLAPFLLWVAVMCRGTAERVAVFALTFVLLLLVKNLTLFVLVGLVSLIVLRTRPLFLMACCLFLVVISNLGYFLAHIPRIGIAITTANLSALVWLQGWEEARIGLRETMGVGLGFQQLGVNGAKGAIARSIAENFNFPRGINLLDGGTLGAKLVAELGFLGIFFVAACSYLIYGAVRSLREIAAGASGSAATAFFYCCLVSFVLDLFVRGTGYFSPSVMLFLTGVFGIWRTNSKNMVFPSMNQTKAAP